MKTTLEIPEDLYRASKTMAARKGIKLKDLFAKGLAMALEDEHNRSRSPTPLETFAMVRETPLYTALEIKEMIQQADRERKAGWDSPSEEPS